MAPQDVQFVPDQVRTPVGEEVAGVSVLGDEPQRSLLSHTADHDRWVRLGESLGTVEGFGELVVLALVRPDLPRPHLVRDLQGLLELFEALSGGREGYA
jgi:hypothetical protein